MLQVKYSVSGSSCTAQHQGQGQSRSEVTSSQLTQEPPSHHRVSDVVKAAPVHSQWHSRDERSMACCLAGSFVILKGLTLNLKCTSTNQSTRMARIFSLMSVCCTGQVSPAQHYENHEHAEHALPALPCN